MQVRRFPPLAKIQKSMVIRGEAGLPLISSPPRLLSGYSESVDVGIVKNNHNQLIASVIIITSQCIRFPRSCHF